MRLKKSLLFFGLVVCFLGCKNKPTPNTEATKMNILWIVADDLGTELGCYGNTDVHTPNIDQLANEGTLYEKHYTVTAVCSPSRSALMTGLYPVSFNAQQHRTHSSAKKVLPQGVYPITHYFRQAGYFTSNGKYGQPDKPGKQDYNFKADSIFDGTDWGQRKPGQPFFAQIQIPSPHRPFVPDTIRPIDPEKVALPAFYPDHPVSRKDWALYLENVQVVDRMVGHILERLEKEGLAENTLVFFFGDQGHPHVRAKQFLYDGGVHTPLIVRAPKATDKGSRHKHILSNIDIPATTLAAAGIKIPEYFDGLDFFNPEQKRAYVYSMRDRRDETVDRIRSVRNQRYKYIRNFYPNRPYTQYNTYKKTSYPTLTLMQVLHKKGQLSGAQAQFMDTIRPNEELYDLDTDPNELTNLAESAAYKTIKNTLSNQLDLWLDDNDTGTYPEAAQQIEFWKTNAKKAYTRKMKRFGLPEDISDEDFLLWWETYLDERLQ
ncbi:sulfatase family protein [Sediminicola luteus]|uniref:Sulfatase N-terminal domain-containing protein n=1 Tax=Sediminicola luteus TaxID=319238 RepID=A0A2A4GCM5_9FLAO|nr:sulfatase [Sediminicola luteus]PCE66699.1 hypothetical protein B7P33_05255 [Sediminicola luteus]